MDTAYVYTPTLDYDNWKLNNELFENMNNILKVKNNIRLLGPIMFEIHPVISTYSGMNLKEIKLRLNRHTGRFKSGRKILNIMHQFSKNHLSLNDKDDLLSTETFYFELSDEHKNQLTAYACSFPKIFPDEDVEIFRVYNSITY